MKKGKKKNYVNVGAYEVTAARFPNLDDQLTYAINSKVTYKEKIHVIADFSRVQSLYFFTKSGSINFEIAIRTIAAYDSDHKKCPEKIQEKLFEFVKEKRTWLMNEFSEYFCLCDIPPMHDAIATSTDIKEVASCESPKEDIREPVKEEVKEMSLEEYHKKAMIPMAIFILSLAVNLYSIVVEYYKWLNIVIIFLCAYAFILFLLTYFPVVIKERCSLKKTLKYSFHYYIAAIVFVVALLMALIKNGL